MPVAACEIPKLRAELRAKPRSAKFNGRETGGRASLSGASVLIAQFDRNRLDILYIRV